MPYFVKKPIPIEARQMPSAFEIHTREGVMRGEIGDYLVTGVHGEQYPVKQSIFEKTYKQVSEKQFRAYQQKHPTPTPVGKEVLK